MSALTHFESQTWAPIWMWSLGHGLATGHVHSLLLFLQSPPTCGHMSHCPTSFRSFHKHHLSKALPGTQAEIITPSNIFHLPPWPYPSPSNVLHSTYLSCVWFILPSHQKLNSPEAGGSVYFVQCCIPSSLKRIWHIIGMQKIWLNK